MLSKSQKSAVSAIEVGKNVFVTGGAGTGKSYPLNYISQNSTKHLHIAASTGIAALNVGGVTLHSWARLGRDGSRPVDFLVEGILSNEQARQRVRFADVLAIDEISMVRSDLFEKFNAILKQVRQNNDPFGGLQLLLFGDFYQLPPVVRREEKIDNPYCFESEAWTEGHFEIHELDSVFRQTDSEFIDLLNRFRFGEVNTDDLALLSQCKNRAFPFDIEPPVITTHNKKAFNVNRAKLDVLGTAPNIYEMKEIGNDFELKFLKDNCLAEEKLVLKKGAQVMMLTNSQRDRGVVNGSTGVIVSFTECDNYPLVKFSNAEKIVIEPEIWEREKYDPVSRAYFTTASIEQVPLMLAWAITVHKSQGMTLDSMQCDLHDAFAPGQVYGPYHD